MTPDEIRQKLQQVKKQRLTELDLSNPSRIPEWEKLTQIPTEVFEWEWLETLNLSWNKLTSVPKAISRLTNLSKLDLSWNKLTSGAESLTRLTNDQFKCNSCRYTTDRDVVAAQVVLRRGLAAVGHTVKMLPGGQGRWTPDELRIFALIGRRVSTNHLRIGATTGRLRLQNAIFCCS